MMKYEILSPEYMDICDSGSGLIHHGVVEANDFQEACRKLAESDPKFKDGFDPATQTWNGLRVSPVI